MWDQFWGEAHTLPEQPPAARPNIPFKPSPRVGERFSRLPTVASNQISSDLPPAQAATKLGNQLKKVASERPPAAWKTLFDEFETQKLVWQSLSLLKGKAWTDGKLANTLAGVERAMVDGSVAAVEQVLKTGDPDGDMYSNTMKEAMENVVRQDRATEKRLLLAERLDLAAIPATLPREEQDKLETEVLVLECQIADKRLERLVRRALLLPIPPELAKQKPALGVPADAKLSSAMSAGTRLSGEPARGARSSRSALAGEPARGARSSRSGLGAYPRNSR